ncbi:MAG: hypothetical protein A2Y76_15495, partial [Planctomycetes bacterium RBG_13_60_9]
ATIGLLGDSAETALTSVFRQGGDKLPELAPSRTLLGHIFDGQEPVDQVTVGCEAPNTFAIHCHGNPLIVERIMALLQRHGVTLLPAEHLLTKTLAAQPFLNAIAAEAKLALTTVKTVLGAEILAHQIESGLSATVRRWQQEIDRMPLSQVAAEAGQILQDSEPARLLISGSTIALIGPPNTGKSTLLNALAGREKAVVTNIPGTTRDWVSAEIHLPPLAATLIDTAGLDPSLAASDIDKAAQRKSLEIIARADLVLLILDLSQPTSQSSVYEEVCHRGHREHRDNAGSSLEARSIPFSVLSVAMNSHPPGDDSTRRSEATKAMVVLNKADLPPRFDATSVPAHLGQPVPISAKQGTGIEELIQAIHQILGTTALDAKTPIAFTPRQT